MFKKVLRKLRAYFQRVNQINSGEVYIEMGCTDN